MDGLRITLIVFTFILFGLFFSIDVLAIQQMVNYTLTSGTMDCLPNLGRCVVSYSVENTDGTLSQKEKIIGYSEINQEGRFSVTVAFQKQNPDVFVVLGSNQLFLGTPFYVSIYTIMTFLTLVILFLFFWPFKNKNLNKKKIQTK